MTIALKRFQSSAGRPVGGWGGLASLALLALGLRLYQLGRSPFWLDELFEYQVSLQSPAVILAQAWHEPWPPLYHFLIRLTSGSGLIHAEWAWRYGSVVAGTLSVLGLFWLLRGVAGVGPALLSASLLALSPPQIYFSQEARAYIVMQLSVLASTSVVWQLSRSSGQPVARRPLWPAWVVLTLLGLYLSYTYAIVWLLQSAYLLWIERARRPALISIGFTALAFAPLFIWVRANLGGALAQAQTSTWLTLPFLAQMAFGGDPNRYGYNSGQVALPWLLGGLACAGALWCLRPRAPSFERYLLAQVAVPLAAFFGLVDGLMHVHLPSYQARQFIVLLPAFFALVGLGIRALFSFRPMRLGPLLAVALWASAVIFCLPGLQRYWTMTKSPEGDLALALRQKAQPGDAVVSLHYSLDGALSFYAPPGVSVYSKPVAEGTGYAFSDSVSLLYTAPLTFPYHLRDIRRSRRVWVLSLTDTDENIIAAISSGCASSTVQSAPPFEMILLEDCPSL